MFIYHVSYLEEQTSCIILKLEVETTSNDMFQFNFVYQQIFVNFNLILAISCCLQKFNHYQTTNNLITRLQAKYTCIEKALADENSLVLANIKFLFDFFQF